ncbi:MAG: hypothetical protein HC831_19385, partial [Chloroflexia bacterium]|nr:hypothetical protein [Chloroflexia bacterium]
IKGTDALIGCASRELKPAERKLTEGKSTEKELLAIVFGCKYFRPFLYGRKFEIFQEFRFFV